MNKVFEVLKKLNIKYEKIKHKPVYTVDQAANIKAIINGIGCKNLFLKDKENYYLYVLKDDKKANLKFIKEKLNTLRLSFASEEDLYEKLKLTRGSVTPLGIINDNQSVILVIDKDLKDKKLLVHPNVNTCTLSVDYNDLIKYINHFGNKYYEI